MGEQTGISWCDSTVNFWMGCQKVSPGCDNCYAEDMMASERSRVKMVDWGPHADRRHVKAGWNDLMKWHRKAVANGGLDPELGRAREVFVNSLGDFFDNHASVTWRPAAWEFIRKADTIVFILVTKRPQNIVSMLPDFWPEIASRMIFMVSTENQAEHDRRTRVLLQDMRYQVQPRAYGLSAEPLLEPIWIEEFLIATGQLGVPAWIVAGGESGQFARPIGTDPFRSLLAQTRKFQHARFHMKQLSRADFKKTFRHFDALPEDLRVREFVR